MPCSVQPALFEFSSVLKVKQGIAGGEGEQKHLPFSPPPSAFTDFSLVFRVFFPYDELTV
jgi:hypothetical protein